MAADETFLAATVQGQLQNAMNFEESSEEKKAASDRLCKTCPISASMQIDRCSIS